MTRSAFVKKAIEQHRISLLNQFLEWVDGKKIFHVHEIGEAEVKKFVRHLSKAHEDKYKNKKTIRQPRRRRKA